MLSKSAAAYVEHHWGSIKPDDRNCAVKMIVDMQCPDAATLFIIAKGTEAEVYPEQPRFQNDEKVRKHMQVEWKASLNKRDCPFTDTNALCNAFESLVLRMRPEYDANRPAVSPQAEVALKAESEAKSTLLRLIEILKRKALKAESEAKSTLLRLIEILKRKAQNQARVSAQALRDSFDAVIVAMSEIVGAPNIPRIIKGLRTAFRDLNLPQVGADDKPTQRLEVLLSKMKIGAHPTSLEALTNMQASLKTLSDSNARLRVENRDLDALKADVTSYHPNDNAVISLLEEKLRSFPNESLKTAILALKVAVEDVRAAIEGVLPHASIVVKSNSSVVLVRYTYLFLPTPIQKIEVEPEFASTGKRELRIELSFVDKDGKVELACKGSMKWNRSNSALKGLYTKPVKAFGSLAALGALGLFGAMQRRHSYPV